MKIPESYIEEADHYAITTRDSRGESMEIGGKIMMNLIVREQMDITKIIATAGTEKSSCLIVVDYTRKEVIAMIRKARLSSESIIQKLMEGKEV